jgi:hypothetical protein
MLYAPCQPLHMMRCVMLRHALTLLCCWVMLVGAVHAAGQKAAS